MPQLPTDRLTLRGGNKHRPPPRPDSLPATPLASNSTAFRISLTAFSRTIVVHSPPTLPLSERILASSWQPFEGTPRGHGACPQGRYQTSERRLHDYAGTRYRHRRSKEHRADWCTAICSEPSSTSRALRPAQGRAGNLAWVLRRIGAEGGFRFFGPHTGKPCPVSRDGKSFDARVVRTA